MGQSIISDCQIQFIIMQEDKRKNNYLNLEYPPIILMKGVVSFIQFKNQMLAGNLNQNMNNLTLNPEFPRNDFCYTIEGNIGCGKSTFLQILRQKVPEAKWIEQPVSEWQNLNGKNINMLQKYYKEPKRWGFTFQIYAIFTRIQKLHEAIQRFPQKIKISERSILADKYVFSELMKDLGYMDESQYQVFKSLYTSFESMTQIEKTKVVYLRCTPEKCHERTKKRQRSEESEIPLDYLTLIHQKHEKWFKSYPSENVLIIDTTQDFKNDPIKIQEMLGQLKEFMEK